MGGTITAKLTEVDNANSVAADARS